MSRKAVFAHSLEHVSRLEELHPGEAYIHRFKSAGRDYKTDIWVAIVLPDSEIERFGLHRRPNSAKSTDGNWTVPANERSYPCFLPARNTFRYAHIEEIFKLPKRPPNNYGEIYGYRDAKIFQKVIDLARRSLGVDFWLNMAREETLTKGKRGKKVSIIQPIGYDTIFETMSVGSNGDSDIYSDKEDDNRSCGNASASTMTPFFNPGNALVGLRSEDISGEYNDQKKEVVMGMNMRQVFQHLFMRDEFYLTISRILRDAVDVQHQPEASQIRSYLAKGEFIPRIIHVNNPTSSNRATELTASSQSQLREPGDIMNLGQGSKLEGINESEELGRQILSLGRLYKQAKNFDLAELMILVMRKLQIAWNSYPGLSQLQPLIEIVIIINPQRFDDTINSDPVSDPFTSWIVEFIAETWELFQYDCTEKFWKVMKMYQPLWTAVTNRRKEFLTTNQERFLDLPSMLQSRDIWQI